MARLVLSWLVLAISILPSYAQSSLQTDQSGYTTGTVGSRSVNTYTDRYGNTTGWIGGKYTSTYSDGYGGTTGTIGNKRINTYEDGYGNTTGTIGRDRVNFQADRSGNITGTIGRRRLNCYTDRFRPRATRVLHRQAQLIAPGEARVVEAVCYPSKLYWVSKIGVMRVGLFPSAAGRRRSSA